MSRSSRSPFDQAVMDIPSDREFLTVAALVTRPMIFCATQPIVTSLRDYYDKRCRGHTMDSDDRVAVPTAVALFANELVYEGTAPRAVVLGGRIDTTTRVGS